VTESITFKLQASKTYLSISILIHLFALVVIWLYSFNNYASLALSAILVVHFYFLNLQILLKKSSAILSFSLNDKAITTTDKEGNSQQYPCVYCAYQSQFLVVINLNKGSLVIFKDSLVSHSLSQLNRLLNA
jgi:hypothetical protein